MRTETEGIALRQTKTAGNRLALELFTRELGKIGVGSFPVNRKKTKSSLAVQPFTYGEYYINKKRDFYDLEKAEVISSFYGIGEKLDRFVNASYIMELTDKLLPEDVAQPEIFDLLREFLELTEHRSDKTITLCLAYEIRILSMLGVFPEIDRCVSCGREHDLSCFSVEDGGMLCSDCSSKIKRDRRHSLIFNIDFDIVRIVRYFQETPFKTFGKVALNSDKAALIDRMLKEYFAYHLGIENLKSESMQYFETANDPGVGQES